MKKIITLLLIVISFLSFSQIVPSEYENIDYLMTFGKEADGKWGDDDHVQTHFFVIPKSETAPVYIRIFDPGTGGKYDTKNGDFNTTCTYTLYAGNGVHSNKAARDINPSPGYDQGKVIYSKTFGNTPELNGKWTSYGPINPSEGEYSEEFGGYIFKMICKGISGDDGNAYKYALSYSKTENLFVENGNIFTYEMCFRLKSITGTTAHVYPFIKANIVAITQWNFDADADIEMRLTSVARKLVKANASLDGKWSNNKFVIDSKEINTSLDLQMIKQSSSANDMCIYILNQFNEAMPLFSVPIGGQPKYKYTVKVKTTF
jgi:hypothetical protein